jgi:hypothetical protein
MTKGRRSARPRTSTCATYASSWHGAMRVPGPRAAVREPDTGMALRVRSFTGPKQFEQARAPLCHPLASFFRKTDGVGWTRRSGAGASSVPDMRRSRQNIAVRRLTLATG